MLFIIAILELSPSLCVFQVVMMVIGLPSPALPTLDTDSPSSTHLGTTQTGIIRGYERSLGLHAGFVKTKCAVGKVSKVFLYSLRLIKDGYQQNYKRGAGQGPRGVSRSSTQAMRT
ncbi:hypothetical protein CHARACLAT_013285 [Characodon lateralis]|uniref:Uncharacterized protein n=1 Tax=Characodon lateralis TaxID=208331 RepID=A0ABU7CN74_9TELE|nr:hypothetical protein [Characodon lateralis]